MAADTANPLRRADGLISQKAEWNRSGPVRRKETGECKNEIGYSP